MEPMGTANQEECVDSAAPWAAVNELQPVGESEKVAPQQRPLTAVEHVFLPAGHPP